MDKCVVSGEAFAVAWKGRRILVLHGSEDRRVPGEYVKHALTRLIGHGAALESKFYPGEDHFLLFSQPDRIRHDIATWIKQPQIHPRSL